jgi:Nif-specific ferredoxin III
MAYITGVTKGGGTWTPEFIMSINNDSCIGCGRCYKACHFSILTLHEDDDDDSAKRYMTIINDGDCVGCMACAVACPKKCFTHAPMEA